MTVELLNGCRLVELSAKGDARGQLVAIEERHDVPFAIARVYYVYGTIPGTTRGLHAHRVLNQLAVAVSGSCKMTIDDGTTRVEVGLDDPAMGLTLGPMIWREMSEFSPDCVLMVLANAPYDEADYIRDYSEFQALVSG